VKRDCSKSRLQPDCDQTTGIAALGAAALIFLAGRRSGSSGTKAADKPKPKPDPPKLTKPEKVARCLTWPVRKRDQEKRRQEENPPPPPEPPKNPCEKRFGCVTVTCGDATSAKPEGATAEEKAKVDETGGLTSIVVKVLGAIATGIGVTGAVVVVGAAIFWARFDAIGVPPTLAVTVIPRTELLVQGAQEMVIFVLVGLGATLFIALADSKGIITRGTLIVLGLLVAGAAGYLILGHAPSLAIACLGIVLGHAGGSTLWVFSSTLLQLNTEDRFRGRVFSAEWALSVVTMSLSSYTAGELIDRNVSAPAVATATGFAVLIPAVLWAITLVARRNAFDAVQP